MFKTTRRAFEVDGRARADVGPEITASFFALVRTSPALGQPFTGGRKRGRHRAEGHSEPWVLADSVRGGSRRGGPRPRVRRAAVLDRRGDAGELLVLDPDVQFWVPLTFTAPQRGRHRGDAPHLRVAPHGPSRAGRGRRTSAGSGRRSQRREAERFPDIRPIWDNTRFHTVVVRLHETLVRDVSSILIRWAEPSSCC